MGRTKIVQTDLDSPHRELFGGSLEIIVALLVFSGINFSCACMGVQSSCRANRPYESTCASSSVMRYTLLHI